jgi:hypothetical protein
MKRRDFLTTTGATSLLLGWPSLSASGSEAQARQLIELRTYHFATGEKQTAFAAFLGKAAVPAYARAGVKPAGIFQVFREDNPDLKSDEELLQLHLVLTYDSWDLFQKVHSVVMADKELLEAGKAVIFADKADPAFLRFESTLMLAFDKAPRVEVPTQAPGRRFQMRIYESQREPHHRASDEEGLDVQRGWRDRDLQALWNDPCLLRTVPGRSSAAQPDLHARIREQGGHGGCLGQVRQGPGLDPVEGRPAIQGYGVEHHEPRATARGRFADLTGIALGEEAE